MASARIYSITSKDLPTIRRLQSQGCVETANNFNLGVDEDDLRNF